jgi:hypothetical protein
MSNQRCQSKDKGKENNVDVPRVGSEPSGDPLQQPDVHGSAASRVQPMAQTVLDRLNLRVQQKNSALAQTPQQKSLQQLGYRLRQWRIKSHFTRQILADKLGMDINQLLCIEAGIGLPEDITETQLSTLATFLTKEKFDQSLVALITHCLALLKT